MRRSIEHSVVVIVGATSGLGYATARSFAELGADLVLAARDVGGLRAVKSDCESAGSTVITVAIDVRRSEDLDRLVEETIGRFGRVDTWVNCAAILVVGPPDATPVEELDRLIDTNIRGTLYASRAALSVFKRQNGGVLINVASLLALFPNPQVSAYVMSKFAIQGLTLSLRHLMWRQRAIKICTVLPGPLDTPMFQRASNHSGRALRAIPPACSPRRAAASIVSCARRPRRQVVIGWTGKAAVLLHRLAPRTVEWVVARASAALVLRRGTAPATPGASFEPPDQVSLDGGWRIGAARRWLGDAIGQLRIRLANGAHGRRTRRRDQSEGLAESRGGETAEQ